MKRPAWCLIVIVRRGGGLLLLISWLLFERGCAVRPATHWSGDHFNRGHNGLWLGVEWVSQPQAPAAIHSLADKLATMQIANVFVYSSYLRSDGTFNQTYAYAADFVRIFRQSQPNIRLLAWIGLPLPTLGGAVDLTDAAVRQKIAAFCAHLVRDLGFDGVQLDPEIVRNGDQNLLALLDVTRQAIGPQAILSLASEKIQPLWPNKSLLGISIEWRGDYYRQVADRVDQLAVMTYDTTLPIAGLYRELLRFEVIALSQTLVNNHTEILIGLSLSLEETTTHHPTAENLRDGLQGLIDGLNDVEAFPMRIDGVALYAEWAMTSDDWRDYETIWLAP